jgi:hypothetical protein
MLERVIAWFSSNPSILNIRFFKTSGVLINNNIFVTRSRDSSVGRATRTGQRPGLDFRQGQKIFLYSTGAHPATYPMDSRGSFLGDIATGA